MKDINEAIAVAESLIEYQRGEKDESTKPKSSKPKSSKPKPLPFTFIVRLNNYFFYNFLY